MRSSSAIESLDGLGSLQLKKLLDEDDALKAMGREEFMRDPLELFPTSYE